MPNYRVTWSIDIEGRNPKDAAQNALEIQRDLNSSAVVFEVAPVTFDYEGTKVGTAEEIDLDDDFAEIVRRISGT